MKRNAGQITVEAVLVLVILVSITLAVNNLLRNQRVLAQMVESPWLYIAGMIENGIWQPPVIGKSKHPNQFTRRGSPTGDTP